MAAAIDARGLKRICMSCGTRFYDMKKRPIVCPGCSEQFTGEIKVKTRRGRVPAAEAEAKVIEKIKDIANDDDTEIVAAESDTVSLEDIKDAEGADEDEDSIELDPEIEGLEELDDDIEEDLDVDVKKGKNE